MTLKEQLIADTFKTTKPTAKQVSELLNIKKEDAKVFIRAIYETPKIKELYSCEIMCDYNVENHKCPVESCRIEKGL
jgi:hypothetical protein